MVWDNLKDAANKAAKTVGDTVQVARNLAADAVGHTGKVIGIPVHIGEEAAALVNVNNAIVAGLTIGFPPLLLFVDMMPIQHNGHAGHGLRIIKSLGDISKLVRGDQPQLLSLQMPQTVHAFGTTRDITACMYDPKNGDDMGLAEYNELQLTDRIFEQENDEARKPFIHALASLQYAKETQNIPLATQRLPEVDQFSAATPPKAQSVPGLLERNLE